MSGTPAGLALLREPFPEHQINVLPRPYKKDSPKGKCPECDGWHGLPAVHLRYVGHAALTDRLLDVDPNWTWEPLAIGNNGLPMIDDCGGMWIKLTVCGVTRLGYGDAQGKTGGDAMKECIGDALRNAAMRFGCALELWHKGELHGDDDNGSTNENVPSAWDYFRQRCNDLVRERPGVFADLMSVDEACEAILSETKVDLAKYPWPDYWRTHSTDESLGKLFARLESWEWPLEPETVGPSEVPF